MSWSTFFSIYKHSLCRSLVVCSSYSEWSRLASLFHPKWRERDAKFNLNFIYFPTDDNDDAWRDFSLRKINFAKFILVERFSAELSQICPRIGDVSSTNQTLLGLGNSLWVYGGSGSDLATSLPEMNLSDICPYFLLLLLFRQLLAPTINEFPFELGCWNDDFPFQSSTITLTGFVIVGFFLGLGLV